MKEERQATLKKNKNKGYREYLEGKNPNTNRNNLRKSFFLANIELI